MVLFFICIVSRFYIPRLLRTFDYARCHEISCTKLNKSPLMYPICSSVLVLVLGLGGSKLIYIRREGRDVVESYIIVTRSWSEGAGVRIAAISSDVYDFWTLHTKSRVDISYFSFDGSECFGLEKLKSEVLRLINVPRHVYASVEHFVVDISDEQYSLMRRLLDMFNRIGVELKKVLKVFPWVSHDVTAEYIFQKLVELNFELFMNWLRGLTDLYKKERSEVGRTVDLENKMSMLSNAVDIVSKLFHDLLSRLKKHLSGATHRSLT